LSGCLIEGFLALTNTTAGAVTVDISLGAHSKELVLTSRETRLLNLRRDFNEQNQRRENRAVLLKLKHNGAPGAIIGTGFVSHDVTPMLTSYRDTSGLILALNSNLPRETGDEASHASSFGAY